MNDIFSSVPILSKDYESEYDCGDGSYMLSYAHCGLDDYLGLIDRVNKSGEFALTDCNSIEGNEHSTFKGKVFLNIYYVPSESKIRIIADEIIPDYPVSKELSGKVGTSLYQFEVDHSLIDCGMCYIVRCDDNSVFVIDSAHYYSVNDDVRIIEFIKKITGEEKPIVSGWFLSHAHEDHIGIFNRILAYHSNELIIERVYYNFPSPNHRDAPWEIPFFNSMCETRQLLSERTEIKQIKLHTGMRFSVRNLEFTVLCTHEDVHPASTLDFNNTSTVIMMSAVGSKILFPGDASAESDKILLGRYNEALSCDIIQISHHGHSGTSPEFYRRANAACALFPVTVIKYDEELPRQEANRTALEISKESYIASNGTVEIPLPYKEGNVIVYPDETIEDFDGIFNLWSYEYTPERKKQLYDDYLIRSKISVDKNA